MFMKKRWSLLLLKHRRQTAKFQSSSEIESAHEAKLQEGMVPGGRSTVPDSCVYHEGRGDSGTGHLR